MTFKVPYEGPHDWLVPRTIYFCRYGSRAYGTSRPDSDEDYRGIVVPPRQYRDGFRHRFEQEVTLTPVDMAIFDIRKFMEKTADANAGFLEFLFVDPEDVLVATPAGKLLLDHRQEFLSRKASHSFRAYAFGQLKKIESHRHWLLNPPTHYPERAEFKLLPETETPREQINGAMAAIQKRMDAWEIDFYDLPESSKVHIQEQSSLYLAELSIASDAKFASAARLLGYNDNLVENLKREKQYRQAVADWKSFQQWKTDRNEARGVLERQFGYDTKHGAHLVRLMRMGSELLAEGTLHVRRADAQELRDIRNGAWSYEKLLAWAKEKNASMLEAEKNSRLPMKPDFEKLDLLCRQIIQMTETEGCE